MDIFRKNRFSQLRHGIQARSLSVLQSKRQLRWFLLIWTSFVYLWGMSLGGTLCGVQGGLSVKSFSTNTQPTVIRGDQQALCQAPHYQLIVIPLVLLSFLMLFHLGIRWMMLTDRISAKLFWLYVGLQCALVFAISVFTQNANIALGLFLALLLEAMDVLNSPVRVLVAVSAYVLCFLLFLTRLWQNLDLSILLASTYMTLIPFVLGFIVLSLQRTSAHRQLVQYAARVEELTRLAERQRLARELHDTLAQGVVGLTLQLETIDGLMTETQFLQAQNIVQQAMMRARGVLTEARRVIDDLRTETLDELDVRDAIEEEAERFTQATSIPCQTRLALRSVIPYDLRDHVLRVIAEGLTNIARHAQAHQAWVEVRQQHDTLLVEIGDDGIGFDAMGGNVSVGHYGLQGLRERARLTGGRLEIASTPGKGTAIRFSVPLPKKYQETMMGNRREGAVQEGLFHE